MPYIAPAVIAKAREMDLLTYLQNYDPTELVHVRGDVYSTRTHDSLKISNGKWYWWSRGIGGTSALDYLIKVNELSFIDAVEQVMGRQSSDSRIKKTENTKDREEKRATKALVLPEKNTVNNDARDYLITRGIAPNIVDDCIEKGLVYQSKQHKNVVFVGKDFAGAPRSAALRGTESDFKGEATGSDKRFSFSLPARYSKTLHLFESAIDVLSFATLKQRENLPWQGSHLLSLAGVYMPKVNPETGKAKLPAALSQFIHDHPEITKVVLRLDNDRAGIGAAEAIYNAMKDDWEIEMKLPPDGKDYNDFLQASLQKKRSKNEKNCER